MSETISRSILELSTDESKLTAGIEKAKVRAAELGASFKKTDRDAKGFGAQLSSLNSLAGALGVSFSMAGVVAFGKSLLDTADAVVKTADRTGLAIDEVQRLQFIAEQSGNSLDDLTGAVNKLQLRLADGSAREGIEALGLNFQELRDKSPYEQMEAVATAIGKIENPALRAQRATQVFGKAGAEVLPTLIANFQELGETAPVMSDSTVQALDAAGDAFGKFASQIKVWAAEAYNYAGGLFDKLIAGAYRMIAGAYDTVAGLTALAAKIPGASKLGVDQSLITSLKGQSQWFRDAAAAMTTHTDAAKQNKPAIAGLPPVHDKATGSAKAHAKAAKEDADAIAALTEKVTWGAESVSDLGFRVGLAIPPMDALGEASLKLGEHIKTGFAGLDNIGEELGPLTLPAVKEGFFQSIFGSPKEFGAALSSTIMGALQGGGDVVNAAGGMIGAKLGSSIAGKLSASLTKEGAGLFSKALGGVFESLLPGIGALIGPLASKLWGGLKSLFGANKEGRNLVKEFIAQNFGNASELQRQLLELGPEYDRLWRGLTQLGNNASTQEAQAAIDAVTAALERHKQKVQEDAAASQQAAADVGAAQQAAVDQAKANLDAIDAEIKQLQDSIANEAPEEEMGIVERITREKIAAMQEQREAAAKTLNDLTQDMTASMNRVADAIERLPDEIALRVNVEASVRSSSRADGDLPVTPMAAGGFGRVRRPALFYSRGNEDFAFSGEGRRFAGGLGGGDVTQRITVELDRRVLMDTVARGLPNELTLVGVGR